MKISVYITSYNQKHYLPEAIDSVLAQTLKPAQVIIVDDVSSDGSPDLIAGYVARYPDWVTAIYHTQNTGVTQARLDALNAVTGDHVTYVDGDDRYLPMKIEKEAKRLVDSPNAQVAFSNNYYMTPEGVHTSVWADEEKPPEGDVFSRTFARDFPRRNLFRMELVNVAAWRNVGFHDPRLRLYEDFDMRIRLSKRLRLVYYDEPLTEIRIHREGLSSSRWELQFEALDYIYRKNKPLLDDVSRSEREYVRRKFGDWIGNIARRAAEEAFQANQHWPAVRLLLAARRYNPSQFSLRLLAQILVPRAAGFRRSAPRAHQ